MRTVAGTTSEHAKSVYAHYGLALYLAQCLERALANALIYVDLIPRKARSVRTKEEWIAEFDSFIDGRFEQTLGGLIRALSDATPVPPELQNKLSSALKLRNWLTHHFFWKRADQFMSAHGRDEMIRELEEAQALFQEADDLLGRTIKPIRDKYGITDQRLRSFYAEYTSNIERDL